MSEGQAVAQFVLLLGGGFFAAYSWNETNLPHTVQIVLRVVGIVCMVPAVISLWVKALFG